MSAVFALVLAFCFERVHMIIAAPNYGSAWNGFGAIEMTNARKIKSPMAYRVLIPWLVALLEKVFRLPQTRRIDVYQTLKVLLTGTAFWGIAQAWGPGTAAVTAVLMLVTIRFDYWSYAGELAGVALVMTGDPHLAVAGAVIAALSKETAPVVALAYAFRTGNLEGALMLGSLIGLIMFAVRCYVGKRESYTRPYKLMENLKRYAARDPETGRLVFFLYQPVFYSDPFIALLITGATLAAVATLPTGWPIPLVLLAAGWYGALSDETRVWTACLPWVAAALVGAV